MIVYAQPGVVVDWNWGDELTAWSTDGPREGWAQSVTSRQRLEFRPRSERAATVAAERWWSGRDDARPQATPRGEDTQDQES